VPIQLDGSIQWSVGKGGFLAMTEGVVKDTKSQGFGKGLYSGEGFFVNRISGVGILFVTSLGAIVQRNLKQGEQWIVDNGHLVAWNCPYSIERSGGGLLSGMHAGEGLVCRFTGPGTIFIQVNIRKRIFYILFFLCFSRLGILNRCQNGLQVIHEQANYSNHQHIVLFVM
jgi:uncharacterized protein (AIM24 family)